MILDASFIVKLFIEEPGSDLAEDCLERLFKAGGEIATVDIALAEALNALWKHVRILKDLTEEDFRDAVSDLLCFWEKLEIVSTRELASEASQLAIQDGITIYDALYIVAASKRGVGLSTFDEKLRNTSKKHMIPVYP